MGCACGGRKKARFLWYDPANAEGVEPVVYNSEVEAKAKVIRKKGKYIPYNPNLSIGAQINAAQSAG